MTNGDNWPKIKKLLHWVWHNPHSDFYQKKYQQAGINLLKDVNSLQDFYQLPYLTRRELALTSPFERLFLPKEKIEAIWFSSGTTDVQNPTILFHSALHPLQQKLFSQHTSKLPIKNLMLLFSTLPTQARLLREWCGHPLKNKNALSISGDINNLPLSAKVAKMMRVDSLKTTPTILYFFIPYLKKEYDLSKILYIFLGGEFCSEQKAKFFKRVFKNAFIQFNFGGNETEMRGFRCQYLVDQAPRFFHPVPIFHWEVINPNQESELVLTHLFTKVAFPLIRYKTEDSVKITTEPCSCGQTQKLEVFGKLEYDVAKIHGATIYANQIHQALIPLRSKLNSLDWQLHIFEQIKVNNLLVKLQLQLIAKKQSAQNLAKLSSLVKKTVSERVYISANMTLAQLIQKGVLLPLEVKFVDSFPFAAKSKQIISHLK